MLQLNISTSTLDPDNNRSTTRNQEEAVSARAGRGGLKSAVCPTPSAFQAVPDRLRRKAGIITTHYQCSVFLFRPLKGRTARSAHSNGRRDGLALQTLSPSCFSRIAHRQRRPGRRDPASEPSLPPNPLHPRPVSAASALFTNNHPIDPPFRSNCDDTPQACIAGPLQ